MIELLFFSGKHCGICQVVKPKLLEAISEKFSKLPVTVIDAEEQQELAAQHLVFTLPVVLIMYEGKEQHRFIKSFSVGEVMEKLERMIQLMQ